jgi:hypothetical protein
MSYHFYTQADEEELFFSYFYLPDMKSNNLVRNA